MNREAIYSALFTKLTAGNAFVTSGRRLRLWDDLRPEQKPALFMLQRGDDYTPNQGTPSIVVMNVDLFVYTATAISDENTPATQMNDLLDVIDTALSPPAYTTVQTLGELVSHCWIEGKALVDTGDIDGQGLAVIPIKILATR